MSEFDKGYLLGSINRIRLEFKVISFSFRNFLIICINRIRLEFKGPRFPGVFRRGTSINRIRLEFKEEIFADAVAASHVLIESDWNLK